MVICILGRQPGLGLAELESRFGHNNVQPLGNIAASVAVEPADFSHRQLGSVIKAAQPLATLPSTDWQRVLQSCLRQLPAQLSALPAGKIKFGISVYGLSTNAKALQQAALQLKKTIRQSGRSIRVIPNTSLELSSAQVLHNQLTSDLGWELLLISDGKQTHLARTISVQDIGDYTKRDIARPKRDAFVGMLPPKLAQIMLNLAHVQPEQRILDPFCGTGVVLQEAALLGCRVYGTDVSERMVRYTQDNLLWLQDAYRIHLDKYLAVADATNATWQQPITAVVSETYLGQPLTSLPAKEKMQTIIDQCDDLVSKFLRNLRPQLQKGAYCTVAVPAWFTGKTFLHLPIVDDLEKMGYNRVSFSFATNTDLLYHRPDQVVARELLVLTVI